MLDPQAFINAIAAKWSARYPQQAAKIVRGAMLALSHKVEPRSADSWRVEGSKGNAYLVEVRCGYHRCSCPDFQLRRERCKHVWATALAVRLEAELQNELTPKDIESFTEPTPKKTEKLSKGLGELCQRLHQENQKRLEQVKPCPVISIHKGERP